MIKWNCNFNIENSTIQVDTAYISVVDFKNTTSTCIVNVELRDITQEILIKSDTLELVELCLDIDAVYAKLLEKFPDSQLV